MSISQFASAQEESDQNRFIFSAIGPGEGKGAIGMGGRVLIIIPMFDLHYVRGFTDNFDLVFDLSTLGIINFVDLGARFRLVGDVDSGFSLAVKAAVSPIIFFISYGDGAAGAFYFAATPGVLASFGGRSTQFTLSLDAPLYFGGAGFAGDESASGSEFTPLLRPALTVEFPVGTTTSMYIQALGYIPIEAGVFVGPFIALGASW